MLDMGQKKSRARQIGVRLDDDALTVLESHRAQLENARPGEKVTISDAVRNLIMRDGVPKKLK